MQRLKVPRQCCVEQLHLIFFENLQLLELTPPVLYRLLSCSEHIISSAQKACLSESGWKKLNQIGNPARQQPGLLYVDPGKQNLGAGVYAPASLLLGPSIIAPGKRTACTRNEALMFFHAKHHLSTLIIVNTFSFSLAVHPFSELNWWIGVILYKTSSFFSSQAFGLLGFKETNSPTSGWCQDLPIEKKWWGEKRLCDLESNLLQCLSLIKSGEGAEE